MIEAEAMNKKCCFAFVESMADFLYCQTSLCMAWDESKGGCMMLYGGGCECSENKTATGMDEAEIRA
jgi:hypothetical protein